mmetsp:Transcript_23573/g.79630  ORF Transcript_23573/g.79630 Transcript_23573/m.79630 type:complete len:603 (+) Transcript_23573:1346-3154(+)
MERTQSAVEGAERRGDARGMRRGRVEAEEQRGAQVAKHDFDGDVVADVFEGLVQAAARGGEVLHRQRTPRVLGGVAQPGEQPVPPVEAHADEGGRRGAHAERVEVVGEQLLEQRGEAALRGRVESDLLDDGLERRAPPHAVARLLSGGKGAQHVERRSLTLEPPRLLVRLRHHLGRHRRGRALVAPLVAGDGAGGGRRSGYAGGQAGGEEAAVGEQRRGKLRDEAGQRALREQRRQQEKDVVPAALRGAAQRAQHVVGRARVRRCRPATTAAASRPAGAGDLRRRSVERGAQHELAVAVKPDVQQRDEVLQRGAQRQRRPHLALAEAVEEAHRLPQVREHLERARLLVGRRGGADVRTQGDGELLEVEAAPLADGRLANVGLVVCKHRNESLLLELQQRVHPVGDVHHLRHVDHARGRRRASAAALAAAVPPQRRRRRGGVEGQVWQWEALCARRDERGGGEARLGSTGCSLVKGTGRGGRPHRARLVERRGGGEEGAAGLDVGQLRAELDEGAPQRDEEQALHFSPQLLGRGRIGDLRADYADIRGGKTASCRVFTAPCEYEGYEYREYSGMRSDTAEYAPSRGLVGAQEYAFSFYGRRPH